MTLADAVTSLAATIEDGTGNPCLTYVPERLNAPSAFITPGSPWVSDAGEFGYVRVSLTVDLVVATASNEVITSRLNQLTEDAIVAVLNDRWFFESASAPYALDANNAQYLAVSLSVSKNIKL
jgi:hypothetical protein